MTQPLSLVPAVPADEALLAAIGREAFEEDKRAYGQGPDIYENPAFLHTLLEDGGVGVRKLVVGEETVGLAITFAKAKGYRWLGCLCLRPKWQGKGYGSQALRLLEAAYPSEKHWGLDTPAANARNLHFYEKAGYRIVGETREPGAPVLMVFEKQKD